MHAFGWWAICVTALDRGGVSSRWKREPEGGGSSRGGCVNVCTFAQLLFNVNDMGPNVNGVILPVGVFVNVNVFNTLTLLVD